MTSTITQIKKQLDYISSSFITDSNVQSVILGKGATTSNQFVNIITNYTNFKNMCFDTSQVGPFGFSNIKVKAKPGTTNTAGSNLTTATIGGNYLIPPNNSSSLESSIVTNVDKSFENFFDINFSGVNFIGKTIPVETSGLAKEMTVLDLLNSLTAAYNFLAPINLKDYKSNGSTAGSNAVKNYAGTSGTVSKTGSDTIIKNQISNVLNIDGITSTTTTARVDAIRRLYLGYIYLIEVYIALYLYETILPTNTNYTTKNILETCIKKFIKLNEEVYSTSTTDGLGNLYKGLETRMTTYNDSKKSLTTIAEDINKTKTDITLEKNAINSHTSFLHNNQMVFYLYVTLFCVLVAVLLYTYYGSMSAAAKQKVMVVITAASLIILVMAFMTYKFIVIEPFAAADTKVALYEDITLSVFNEYLNNTVNILRLLDTYRSYGEISQSINKEKNYYTNISDELKLNKGGLNAIQAERLRQGKILRYRTYLFIQILITLSFLMLLLSYQYNILYIVIAAFIILTWVYLYVFNINNLVRTDSSKLYWGQPDMS